jgi:hypothetical protein
MYESQVVPYLTTRGINIDPNLECYLKQNVIINNHNTIIEPGETRSDLNYFTALSTNLNKLCYTIFNQIWTQHKTITQENFPNWIDLINAKNTDDINTIFSNIDPPYYPYDDKNNYNLTGSILVNINEILHSVKNFLIDYITLMTTDTEHQFYVIMPINYLLKNKGYDGVYNKNGDTANSGSVKYFFQNEYPARGFLPNQKHVPPLTGRIILSII